MSEPSIIKPEDINPNYDWHRRVPSHGRTNVDYEERINFLDFTNIRLGRAREALKNSKAGSLLCFDNNNIRYLTSTVIGEWSRDKICRYSLLAQDHDPCACGILDQRLNIINYFHLGFQKKIGRQEW